MITVRTWELVTGCAMVILDFIMAISLMAGYESRVLSWFLPFRTRPDKPGSATNGPNMPPHQHVAGIV